MEKLTYEILFPDFKEALKNINEFTRSIREPLDLKEIDFELYDLFNSFESLDIENYLLDRIIYSLNFKDLSNIIEDEGYWVAMDDVNFNHKEIWLSIYLDNNNSVELSKDKVLQCKKYFEDYFNNGFKVNVELS